MAVDSWGNKNEPQFADSGAPDIGVDPTAVGVYAAKVGNRRVGSTAERNAATGKDVWAGLEWYDTTEKRQYVYDGGWTRVLRHAFGTFVGATSGTGTATISHGLPTTPAHVIASDWNSGTNPGTRKVLHNTSNSTQSQFVVLDAGAPLASNPVVFSWMAAY